jgi:hypothetical protein
MKDDSTFILNNDTLIVRVREMVSDKKFAASIFHDDDWYREAVYSIKEPRFLENEMWKPLYDNIENDYLPQYSKQIYQKIISIYKQTLKKKK